MIISASRRTDIPACYPEKFMNWIRSGYCEIQNPYTKQFKPCSLKPEDADCIVFWTKNPIPILPYLLELKDRGYSFYFQYTLNAYSRSIEPNLPSFLVRLQSFHELTKFCPVIWRYDPIIFSKELGFTEKWHLTEFKALTEFLEGSTTHCIISFLDFYDKVIKDERCKKFDQYSLEEMISLAIAMKEIAGNHGIEISACGEKVDLQKAGIAQAHCIDGNLISQITGKSIIHKKDKSQREECGCMKSQDIGQYHTCKNGCIYCYAS